MASIAEWIEKIKTAIYGEEVRGAIWQSLDAMNTQVDAINVDSAQIEQNKQNIATNTAAITALNSSLGSLMADGTDLNTLTLPAGSRGIKVYYGQKVTNLVNYPNIVTDEWPWCLILIPIGSGGTYTKQVLHVYGTYTSPDNVYERTQTYSGGTTIWSTWVKLPTRSEVDALNASVPYVANKTSASNYINRGTIFFDPASGEIDPQYMRIVIGKLDDSTNYIQFYTSTDGSTFTDRGYIKFDVSRSIGQ